MKFNIDAQSLRDGLNKILSVVDKKNSRPILTNCLVTTENNKINLIATDLEVSAKIILDCEIIQPGNFCINTKNIFDILRELPDEVINFEVQNSNILNLNCKNIDYSLLITTTDEFPTLSFENSNNKFKLSAKNISNIISKTSYAISTDETRLFLNGIYLQQIDSKLRAVAIDGHRLALLDNNEFKFENDFLQDGIIIPRKGINELRKISDSNDGDIEISLDDSFMYVNAHDRYLLSIRLIARDYPKYQTVIPNKTAYKLIVEKPLLLNAVRRIRILSNEKTNGIKMGVSGNKLTLSANHASLGNAKETLDVSYEGEDIEIGFNAKYLIESLSVFDDTDIIFEFNNELTPVIVRNEVIPDYLGIIMPLKL